MVSSASTPLPPSPRRWLPIVIGVVGTAVIIAVAVVGWHWGSRPAGRADPGYVPRVLAQATRVSQAQTMMAGSVIYVDGTVANTGTRTVTQANATLRFSDVYGQLAQLSRVSIVDANSGPLRPGQRRSFRLGFDHVSAQWNQAPPAVKITQVYTR